MLLQEKGFPLNKGIKSVIVEMCFLAFGASLTVLLLYWKWNGWFIAISSYLMFLLLHQIILKKFISLNFLEISLCLLLYLGIWLLQGSGFFLLSSSFLPSHTVKIWGKIVGYYSLSWLGGFAVFFLPAGLGVRETGLFFLLKKIMPEENAILLPFIVRLWNTSGELIFSLAVICGIMKRRFSRREKNKDLKAD